MSLLDIEQLESNSDINLYKNIMQKRMIVSRIIHPVGQGAFYTERIRTNGKTFNIVYDCGSENRKNPTSVLKQEIASYYTKGDTIDILFISHFDYDHINGINELIKHTHKIKNIVVPLIEKRDFWFYYAENETFLSFYNSLDDIAESVYRVKSANENDAEIRFNDIRPIVLSEKERGSFDIPNATRLLFEKDFDWCYIPFNYDQKTRLNKLKAELAQLGLTENVLNGDWDTIKEHLDKIKSAYKKVIHDGANKTSLILYSGGVGCDYRCRINHSKMRLCCCRPYRMLREEGCLYFGDNDLNQQNLLNDLQCKLGSLIERIGTIQVPHHGAYKNFNYDVLHIFNQSICYFASFGVTNPYGHPSYKVVADIEMHSHFIGVTEDRDSALVETIYRR